MLKAVIFDFDGTIADTLPLVLEEGRKVAESEGYEFPHNIQDLRAADEETLKEMFPQLTTIKIPYYFKKLRDMVGERIEEAHLFIGMKEVIEGLAKNFRLGLLSTNKKEYVEKFMKKHGLWHHFEEFTLGLSLRGKQGKLSKLVKKLGVEKEEAVYVADGEKDIEACRDDEVKIISVTWGYNDKEVLEQANPDFIADSPKDIIRIVNELSKDET